MENKLISMVDFVLHQGNPSNTDSQFSDKVMAYANFLKQPLTLGMFVPVMSNDIIPTDEEIKTFEGTPLFEEYQEAKDRVLFEGFEIIKRYNEYEDYCVRGGDYEERVMNYWDVRGYWNPCNELSDIESLLRNFKDLELTPTALKQIAL